MFRGIAEKLIGRRRAQFGKGMRGEYMREPTQPKPGGPVYMAHGGGIGRQSLYTNVASQNIDDETYAMGGGVRGEIEDGGLGAYDEDEAREDNDLESYLAHGGLTDGDEDDQDDEDMDQGEQRYAEGGVAGNGPDSSGRPRKKFWHDRHEPGVGVADAGSEEQWSRGIDPMVQPGGRDARVLAQKTMDGLENQDHPAGEARERIDAAWEAVGHRPEWDKSDMRGTAFSSHEEGEPGAAEDEEEEFAEGGFAGQNDGAYNDGSEEDAKDGGEGSSGLIECAKEAIAAFEEKNPSKLARALKDFVELADED